MSISDSTQIPHWVIAGQSNCLSRADTRDVGGEDFDFTFPGGRWWRYLEQASSDVDWDSEIFDTMEPKNFKFGIERPLRERFAAHLTTVGVGASKLSRDWLVDDVNHVKLVNEVTAALSALGRSNIDGLIWFQGTNDALDETAADAYSANLGTLFTDLRSRWGSFPIILVLIHASNGATYTSTVRTQQETYVSGDANCHSVDPDSYTNSGAHYPTDSYVLIAQAIHSAIVLNDLYLSVAS